MNTNLNYFRIKNGQLPIPEGMTGKELKKILDYSRVNFPQPKKKENLVLKEKYNAMMHQKEMIERANNNELKKLTR